MHRFLLRTANVVRSSTLIVCESVAPLSKCDRVVVPAFRTANGGGVKALSTSTFRHCEKKNDVTTSPQGEKTTTGKEETPKESPTLLTQKAEEESTLVKSVEQNVEPVVTRLQDLRTDGLKTDDVATVEVLKTDDMAKTEVSKVDDLVKTEEILGTEDVRTEVLKTEDVVKTEEVMRTEDVVKTEVSKVDDLAKTEVVLGTEDVKTEVLRTEDVVKTEEVLKTKDVVKTEVSKVDDVVKMEEVLQTEDLKTEVLKTEDVVKTEDVLRTEDVVKTEVSKVDDVAKTEEVLGTEDVKTEVLRTEDVVKTEEVLKTDDVVKTEEVLKTDDVVKTEEVLKTDDVLKTAEALETDVVSLTQQQQTDVRADRVVAKENNVKKPAAKSGKQSLLDLLGAMKVEVTTKRKPRIPTVPKLSTGLISKTKLTAKQSTASMFENAAGDVASQSNVLDPALVAAASAAASTLPNSSKAESELLKQLRENEAVSEAQRKGDLSSLGSLIADMKVGKRNTRQNKWASNQIRFDEDGKGYTQDGGITAELGDVRRRQGFLSGRRLNIFPAVADAGADETTVARPTLWDLDFANQLSQSTNQLPRNGLEEMIQWTKEGKLWQYPINNEAGLEEEASVSFHEHIFLDKHLEEGFPRQGPIRHFMELVVAGLSRNPYLTVQQKKDHINWFRDYFQQKEEVLKEADVYLN